MKFLVITLLAVTISSPAFAAESAWPGVDVTVVEQVAGEHGRQAVEPLINTDQGDLLLFAFLVAGAIAGFVAGYYWKSLINKPDDKS